MKHHLYGFLTIILMQGTPSLMVAQNVSRPNIVLVMTDDQGYGDFGFTGNPWVSTPALDALSRESIRLDNFYVSPVCAPTRSSLMTGRYSLRTGIRDTYNGGAIMATSEVTVAELLKDNGYRTGIFGKWHLGDNYPSRPMDQGFDESLIHLSGGIGQVGDITTYFKGDSSYFDPVLWHNGKPEQYHGYCSDVFATAAIEFIEKNARAPFFCYLAFNAPHTPLQVPRQYYEKYKNVDPSQGFPSEPNVLNMTQQDKEDARKVYAMVSNIDENISQLLSKLEDLGIARNTLFIFMTDNGPQQRRYVGGMRGLKGSVYRGGIRVPCLVRFPARWKGNRTVNNMTAHIDWLPTLVELCSMKLPQDRRIDGRSLVSLFDNSNKTWADRELFFYWTRMYPERYNNMALQTASHKLVGETGYDATISDLSLYNLITDPTESNDLITRNPGLATQLKSSLDEIYNELIASENMVNPPRIEIGTPHENPVMLNRNDAGGERGIWAQEEIYGKWRVHIRSGKYNVKYKFINAVPPDGTLYLETSPFVNQRKNTTGSADVLEMKDVYLPAMDCDLVPFYTVGQKRIFPFFVSLEKVN
jgi:arylsulfatase